MIGVSKHIITFIITAILAFAVYSFITSFSLSKKLDYYKHANTLIAETFTNADKVNDNYQMHQYDALRFIKTTGKLSNEEITYIDKHSKSYNSTNRMF